MRFSVPCSAKFHTSQNNVKAVLGNGPGFPLVLFLWDSHKSVRPRLIFFPGQMMTSSAVLFSDYT